jgi:ubiquinone/menaquinone biosynthesis C-methylase UbiE
MRIAWAKKSHEKRVEDFFARGGEHYGEFHNGYLNFGLWEDGISEYVAAAENLVRRIGTLLRLNGESRLLDVACGTGTQDILLYRTFRPVSIEAVDVTWKHIEHGKRRAVESGVTDRVRFQHGTATNLPFSANSFSHVMSIEGPEQFHTREDFFREAYRVLQPAGVLGLADYTVKRQPKNWLERIVVKAACIFGGVPKENIDSLETYGEKLARSGFRNISLQEVGALTIPGYYFEQRRPAIRRAVKKMRGFIGSRIGTVMDVALYQGFRRGLLEYILVRAVK